VCGGRPTYKDTRIDVRHALELLVAGRSMEEVATCFVSLNSGRKLYAWAKSRWSVGGGFNIIKRDATEYAFSSRQICDEVDLSIVHFDVQESGFTSRAIKIFCLSGRC